MVKLLLIIFVTVVIFTGALYVGIFGMIWSYISLMTTDFLPFIPLEFRLWFFFILLWLIVALGKSFIH
jgi:hypothetical protein